jgi:hypothetical protein
MPSYDPYIRHTSSKISVYFPLIQEKDHLLFNLAEEKECCPKPVACNKIVLILIWIALIIAQFTALWMFV